MTPYSGSISEALDECEKAHDKAYATISPDFKKKIKLAEKRIEKAEAEYNQIKEEAEKSMDPKLREKLHRAGEKLGKVWHERDNLSG